MNQTLIRKLLSEAVFNPKEPGILQAILESKDPSYLIQRSIEFLREAQIATAKRDKDKALKMATQLITMARSLIGAEQEKSSTPQTPCNVVFHAVGGGTVLCTKFHGHSGFHANVTREAGIKKQACLNSGCVLPKGHRGEHQSHTCSTLNCTLPAGHQGPHHGTVETTE